MKSLSFKEPWVNAYVERMLGLSTATKKAIIRLLEKSIQEEAEKKRTSKKTSSENAFGAWVGPETAEEIIEMIYKTRTFGRQREPLDG